jgi:hypothetical protein
MIDTCSYLRTVSTDSGRRGQLANAGEQDRDEFRGQAIDHGYPEVVIDRDASRYALSSSGGMQQATEAAL